MALKMDEVLGTGVFPHLILEFVMTDTKHDLLTKFFKMKSLTIQVTEFEDAF